MIAIIDYGIGNLGSVSNAFKFLGFDAKITSNKEEILQAEKVVLPGVGAFSDAMNTFKEKGFDDVINKCVKMNKPILGICVGMQMLFEKSYEYGQHDGLGLLKGEIVKFPEATNGIKNKIPQIGWNDLAIDNPCSLFDGLEGEHVYFVHSYYLTNNEKEYSALSCEYAGVKYTCAIHKGNLYATQFHPEKSGKIGLEILRRFATL